MRSRDTPNDPERRERIVAASVELVTEGGVGAVTARAAAARAGVPLGSVSYHFDSVRTLLLETSRRVIASRSARLRAWFEGADGGDVARRLADLVHHHLTTLRSETIVAYELYLLGLRDEDFRAVSDASIPALRRVLAEVVGADEATGLAATADGFQLESLFRPEPPSLAEVRAALDASPPREPRHAS